MGPKELNYTNMLSLHTTSIIACVITASEWTRLNTILNLRRLLPQNFMKGQSVMFVPQEFAAICYKQICYQISKVLVSLV